MRRILITGGTGSLGTVLISKLLTDKSSVVICYSRDVHRQHDLLEYLERLGFSKDDFEARLRLFIGDVRDRDRLSWAMRGVTDVVHAAALKHVGEGEYNPLEFTLTNVVGSENVALEAIKAGVERCLFISTDKAPNAINLYGRTKAVAERTWIRLNQYGHPKTRLSALRYGNVFDSRGSVVGVWQDRVKRGLPIEVRYPEPTRFVCFLSWGIRRIQSILSVMRGGEVFVPAMLNAVSLHKLARYLQPDESQWTKTDLPSSEKQHEILIAPEEYGQIAKLVLPMAPFYIINPDAPQWGYEPWIEPNKDKYNVDHPYSSGNVPRMPPGELMSLIALSKEV